MIQVPIQFDNMMYTSSCKRVKDFIVKNKFDMEQVTQLMRQHFGGDVIDQTTTEMEQFYGVKSNNIKTYFNMLDTRIAELT